ncbi:MAG: hypothetical protein O2894_05265 [Planctomycetota bacterium]|nr:hypothetical protein [Planctomycetota bacterium]
MALATVGVVLVIWPQVLAWVIASGCLGLGALLVLSGICARGR